MFSIMKRLAQCFALVCDRVSLSSVSYLDVRLTLQRALSDSVVVWEPYFKPTALGRPLALSSAHPPHIAKWPLSVLKRLARLSHSREAFEVAKRHFVSRFRDSFAPAKLISTLTNFDPYLKLPLPREVAESSNTVWLVLPYHEIWHRAALTSALRRLTESPLSVSVWKSLGSAPPIVKIAWANTLPTVMKLVDCKF
jgi:hypothetical protein